MSELVKAWLCVPPQRRRRLVLVLLAAVLLASIVWAARGVLGPYMLGLALAYLLAPFVALVERGLCWVGEHRRLGFFRTIARPFAIFFSYILLISVLVGFFSLIVPLLVEQGKALWAERDTVWKFVTARAETMIEQYRLLDPGIQAQVEQTLGRFSELIGTAVQQALGGTAVAISYTISLVLAIFIIPFWTFYLLKDSGKLGAAVVRTIPSPIRQDMLQIITLVDGAVGAYLRGQMFLGLIIGCTSAIGLSLLGVRFSLLLGLIAGIFELIPNIGPLLGAIPAILVALTQEPILLLWTTLFAVGLQQVENLFLTPRVLGQSVQLHPVVVMVVLVIGSEIGGVFGLFLAPVVTAVLRDLFRYLYYRVADEPLSPVEALLRVRQGEPFNLEV